MVGPVQGRSGDNLEQDVVQVSRVNPASLSTSLTFIIPGSSLLWRVIMHSHLMTTTDTDTDGFTVLFLTKTKMVLCASEEDVEDQYECDKMSTSNRLGLGMG